MTTSPDYPLALDCARHAVDRFLRDLGQRPVAALQWPELSGTPEAIGFSAALQFLREHVEPYLSASPGPRYLGFVTGGVTPEALAADWIASAWDQNVSNSVGSIAAELESRTTAAFGQLFGLGERMHGQFVSGATSANLVGMATARHWAQKGHGQLPLVFAGSTHSCILKAMAISGIDRGSDERARSHRRSPDMSVSRRPA